MLNKTRAIVLHHVKYGESSLIVSFYTEKYGRLSCMVSGVRTKKSKFPATLFQPLTLIDADFYYRQNRDLQRLKEAACSVHYMTIPFNVSKSAVAIFLSEVLYISLREEESNPVVFAFIYNALQLFDSMDDRNSTFHLWFMMQLTRYLGFFPPEQIFEQEGLSSPDFQVFQAMPLGSRTALKLIVQSVQSPPDLKNVSGWDRNELLSRIIKYYALHVDGFSKLRSFKILQEVFRD